MAKSSKKSRQAMVPEGESIAPDAATASSMGTDEPLRPATSEAPAAKPAKATEQPKAGGKRAGQTARKIPRTTKPRAATTARKSRGARSVVISEDDIRLRAYFIAERRMQ